MKISILNHSDSIGGAARATYRIHRALRRSGIDSTLWVAEASTGDWTVSSPKGRLNRLKNKLRPTLGSLFTRLMGTRSPILHSPALFSSSWPRHLNASDVDIVHLVWVNNEMLSIEDIGRIKKPVVWTLQDMWAICGAEHVSQDQRFIKGYEKDNRPEQESGLDLNRFTWLRKRRAWQQPLNIVVPSRWMADCVSNSALMKNWPVTVIPNPIDTDRWFPVEKKVARTLAGLPYDRKLLLFGTAGSNDIPYKGFDLLKQALSVLKGRVDLELVIFGQMEPENPPDFGFPVHYMGHLHDDVSMQVLYSAADAVVIPSRVDNLPNVGIEAIACGTPVVAFDVCGLPDIVKHKETGYLAKAFDLEDLAAGVLWVFEDENRYLLLSSSARNDAIERFSYPVIAKKYQTYYERVLGL